MPKKNGLIIIKSEQDAFDYLAAMLVGPEPLEREALIFDGWPSVRIRLPKAHARTLTPSMMQAFIEFQASIYRVQQLIDEGTIDLRSLSEEERRLYEFEVEVTEGSSISDIDLTSVLTKLGGEIVAKMTPEYTLIAILGVALLFGASSVCRALIQSRIDIRKAEIDADKTKDLLESQKFLSEQNLEQMKILAEAMKVVPVLKDVDDLAAEGNQALVHGISTNGGGELQGAYLDPEVGSEILKTKRSVSREETFDGAFTILRNDPTAEDGFRLQLQNIETGEEFFASLQDRFAAQDHYDAAQSAEWRKVPLRAKIRARRLRGKIVEAVILNAALHALPED